ncbi:hypothetical protein [Variovorax sp. AFSI2.2]|uniref:hypothetical protein n=1 Tax=Variovorax sp. AFSI2.2 TaxID=3384160 RepID=UPI003EB92B2F
MSRHDVNLDLVPIHNSRFERRLPPVTREELASMDRTRCADLVPAGWVFYSADFALQSADPTQLGTVMLMRDAAGTKDWLALSEADRAAKQLFQFGKGMTVNAAIADAAAKIRGSAS